MVWSSLVIRKPKTEPTYSFPQSPSDEPDEQSSEQSQISTQLDPVW